MFIEQILFHLCVQVQKYNFVRIENNALGCKIFNKIGEHPRLLERQMYSCYFAFILEMHLRKPLAIQGASYKKPIFLYGIIYLVAFKRVP
jgi:hypothetical protein